MELRLWASVADGGAGSVSTRLLVWAMPLQAMHFFDAHYYYFRLVEMLSNFVLHVRMLHVCIFFPAGLQLRTVPPSIPRSTLCPEWAEENCPLRELYAPHAVAS